MKCAIRVARYMGMLTCDGLTQDAIAYFRLRQRGSAGLRIAERKFPHIVAAELFWANPLLRAQLQRLLLANCEVAEIGQLLKIEAAAIQTAEELHFDVRPMLESSNWILVMVIRREADAG